jgi:hypothetical protein
VLLASSVYSANPQSRNREFVQSKLLKRLTVAQHDEYTRDMTPAVAAKGSINQLVTLSPVYVAGDLYDNNSDRTDIHLLQ